MQNKTMQNKTNKKFFTAFFIYFFFFVISIFSFFSVSSLFAYECVVEKVVDGDTFICSRQKIRLIGIDTPESTINPRLQKQRNLGDLNTILHYGNLAKNFLKQILPPGSKVKLEFDVQKNDRYGRLLTYVWLPDGRMLNELILKEGYAMLYTVPPNVKYQERLKNAYREAVERKKGLWKN